MAINNTLDLLLALIYVKGATGKNCEAVKGFTRLQKLFFLLWQEGGFDKYIPQLKEFEAYNYGPFSNSLFDDVEFAKSIDLIEVEFSKPTYQLENAAEVESVTDLMGVTDVKDEIKLGKNINTREDFKLTDRGREVAEEILSEMSKEDIEMLIKIKTLYNQKPFMELIRYVYNKYPDYAKRSLLI